MSNKKRDLELVCKILLVIEDSSAAEITSNQSLVSHELIREYDENVVDLHVRLLMNAGLIDVSLRDDFENKDYFIKGITWSGYDYLEKARKKMELLGRVA